MILISEDIIERLVHYIESETGIDFSNADKYQINKRLKTIESILEKRSESFSSLFDSEGRFCGDKNLRQDLINVFTNNETAFFRDVRPFEMLTHLLETQQLPSKYLSILSLPCSTGQETYSILIKLLESGMKASSVNIIGADIDTDVLDKAKKGKYNKFELMRGLSDNHRNKYFESENGSSQVKSTYRSMIKFQQFNLAIDQFGIDEFDVIFLRNVLFYFKESERIRILDRVVQSLKKGGIILLGNGEKVPNKELAEQTYEGMLYYVKS